jgi:exopolysaccharide biosynthesis protein
MNRKSELRICLRKAGLFLLLTTMLTTFMPGALAVDGEGGAETVPAAQHYTIPEDALEAPMPVYDNYGAAPVDEAYKLTEVIQQARDSGLLGQDEVMAFDPDARFYRGLYGRNIEYYLDDSILVILWKEDIEGKCCTFAEVKIADPSQFRRKLAEDTYGSEYQYFASQLGEQVHAVLTMNADYYLPREFGIVVWNRDLYRFDTGYYAEGYSKYNCVDTLFVNSSGDFLYKRMGEENTPESIEDYVRENDILFSVAFGPVLVENGEAIPCSWYPLGEVNMGYSRAGIGQMGKGHYLYMSLNHGSQEARWTVTQFAQHFAEKPVLTAYCLDGGQTGEVYFCGSVYNYIDFGVERTVSDILYFATAIP